MSFKKCVFEKVSYKKFFFREKVLYNSFYFFFFIYLFKSFLIYISTSCKSLYSKSLGNTSDFNDIHLNYAKMYINNW